MHVVEKCPDFKSKTLIPLIIPSAAMRRFPTGQVKECNYEIPKHANYSAIRKNGALISAGYLSIGTVPEPIA